MNWVTILSGLFLVSSLLYAIFLTIRRRVYKLALTVVICWVAIVSFGIASFWLVKPHFQVITFVLTMSWGILVYFISKQPRRKIVLIPRCSSYFGKEMVQAICDAVKERVGVDPDVLPVGGRKECLNLQINHLDKLLRKKPDAILVLPVEDNDEFVERIIKAIKNKIPVITIDRHLSEKKFFCKGIYPPFHVASNFQKGGELAAEIMLHKLNSNGNIAIITGPTNAEVSRIRASAFVDKILEHVPNVTIVYRRTTDWTKKEAKERAQEILDIVESGKVKSINGIFCCSDGLALGVEETMASSNVNAAIIGYDGIHEVQEKIQGGKSKIYATIDVDIKNQAEAVATELDIVFQEGKRRYIKQYHPPRLIQPKPMT